jgi:heme/copper-type cytochrome/quinol oxidase subunit 2
MLLSGCPGPQSALDPQGPGARLIYETWVVMLAGGFAGVTNELRLPVGETVEVTLRSADVIHSFWVPNLAGKVDLIPGRANRLVLRADRPGRLRGQCAEFCGGDGHARMTFEVIVEPRVEFERWLAMHPVVAQPGVASTDVAQGRP